MVCTVIEVVELCCRGGELVRVLAGVSLVVSGHWWLGSLVRCWCWHWVQGLGKRKRLDRRTTGLEITLCHHVDQQRGEENREGKE